MLEELNASEFNKILQKLRSQILEKRKDIIRMKNYIVIKTLETFFLPKCYNVLILYFETYDLFTEFEYQKCIALLLLLDSDKFYCSCNII